MMMMVMMMMMMMMMMLQGADEMERMNISDMKDELKSLKALLLNRFAQLFCNNNNNNNNSNNNNNNNK